MVKIYCTVALLAPLFLAGLPGHAQESPTPTGLAWLAQTDMEGPVTVMDLVKFRPDGEKSYDEYDALAEAKLTSLGGEVVFRGYTKLADGLDSSSYDGLDPTSWDRVTMRMYPTAKAVVEMGSSEEYRAAFPKRTQGVEKALVYAFGSGFMRKVAVSDSANTVYMLNLLRFKDDGGEAGYRDYGTSAMPVLLKSKARPVLDMRGLTAVTSEEEIDRLILVSYPSPETFLSMIRSADYRAVAHKRTDSIELGLLFPFSDER